MPKPLTAYNKFVQKEMKNLSPNLKATEKMKKVAKMWKSKKSVKKSRRLSDYNKFVKKEMKNLSPNLKATEKMKKVAKMWKSQSKRSASKSPSRRSK